MHLCDFEYWLMKSIGRLRVKWISCVWILPYIVAIICFLCLSDESVTEGCSSPPKGEKIKVEFMFLILYSPLSPPFPPSVFITFRSVDHIYLCFPCLSHPGLTITVINNVNCCKLVLKNMGCELEGCVWALGSHAMLCHGWYPLASHSGCFHLPLQFSNLLFFQRLYTYGFCYQTCQVNT